MIDPSSSEVTGMPTNAPAPAQPPAVAASNVPALDGLRGFAALTVFVSHFSNAFNLWGGLLGSGAGQVGGVRDVYP